MILILLSLILWVPSIIGWGSFSIQIRRYFKHDDFYAYDIAEPIIGMAILATLSSVINLFLPINKWSIIFALIIGWLLFILRIKRSHAKFLSPSMILFSVLFLIVISFFSTHHPLCYDSGLYHLPAIQWMNEETAVFGLANLHGRLGFNASWFPLAAIVENPFAADPTISSSYILTALLIFFLGLEIYRSTREMIKTNQWTQQRIFLFVSVLIISSSILYFGIGSPTPDIPVLVFTLLISYFALGALESNTNRSYTLWLLSFIALFSISIKLSALPLLLIPVSIGLYVLKSRIHIPWRKYFKLTLLSVLFLFIPWTIRGIISSGCLVYPLSFTCFYKLPWTVLADKTQLVAMHIKSWARAPELPAEQVLSNWDWFLPWVKSVVKSPAIVVMITMTALSLPYIISVLLPGNKTAKKEIKSIWLAAPLFVCVLFWFLTAPDLRFGEGYLWALYLLWLGGVMHQFFYSNFSKRIKSLGRLIFVSLIGLISLFFAGLTVQPVLLNLNNESAAKFLFSWPDTPAAPVSQKITLEGVPVNIPIDSDQCWLTDLPCAPYFDENLQIKYLCGDRMMLIDND